MTILVTGAAGFVGLTLVQRLLEQGRTVRTLDLATNPPLDTLPVQQFTGDITRPETLDAAFAGVEIVYHVAAYISIQMYEWDRLEAINVRGVENVIAMCRRHGVRRMVHFSSIEVFDTTDRSQPINEDRELVAPDFHIPYPRSKALGHRLVQQAAREDLDTVIVIPGGIIGPNDPTMRGTNQILLPVALGRQGVVPNLGYNFVDVRDVVAGAIAAAERAPRGAAYFLGGSYTMIPDMARYIAALTGVRPPRIVPVWLLKASVPVTGAVAAITGKPSTITDASLYALLSFHTIRDDRARRELDHAPRPLTQTLDDLVAWFRTQGWVA